MQIARIKQFPTSKEPQCFYVDPNFFCLMKRPAHGNQEVLLKSILEMIARGHIDQPELYLDRVIKLHEEAYKVLVHDGTCVKPIMIDLSNHSSNNLEIDISETASYPDELDPNKSANHNTEWLAPNLKEGIRRFEQEVPTAPLVFSAEHYSVELAAKQFQALEAYADVNKHYQKNDEKLCQLLQTYNLLFKEVAVIEPMPRDTQIEELFDQVTQESLEKQMVLNETLDSLATDLDEKYAKFSNAQEKLNCAKIYLAWAVHATAVHCNQSKISSDDFNKHFENVVCIEPEGITDVKEVCQIFSSWSLEQIENYINRVMSAPYNPTSGWHADKQNEFMKNINDRAEQLKSLLDLNAAPFAAYHSRIPFKSAVFSLKEMKKLESEKQSILSAVNTIADNKKYQAIKTMNFDVEELLLTEVEDKLKSYKIIVDDYKKLIDQQNKSAQDLKKKVADLHTWLAGFGAAKVSSLLVSPPQVVEIPQYIAKDKVLIQASINHIENLASQLTIPKLAEDVVIRNEQMNKYQNKLASIQEKIDMIARQKIDLELLAEVQRGLKVISDEIDELYQPLAMNASGKVDRELGDEFLKHQNGYAAARAQIERLKRKLLDYPPVYKDQLRNMLVDAQNKIKKSYDEIQTHHHKMQEILQSLNKGSTATPEVVHKNENAVHSNRAAQIHMPIVPPIREQATQTLDSAALPRRNFKKSTPAVSKPQASQVPNPGFFERHGKAILMGAGMAIGVGVLTLAALSQLGLTATVITAIGAGTAKIAAKLGVTLSESASGLIGLGGVTAGLAGFGAVLGGIGNKLTGFLKKSQTTKSHVEQNRDLEKGDDSRYQKNSNASVMQRLRQQYNPQWQSGAVEADEFNMIPKQEEGRQISYPQPTEQAADTPSFKM